MDGSPNKNGRITHFVPIQYEFGGKTFNEEFHITHLGDQKIILGMPWLESHNPLIDWRRKTIAVPTNPSRKIGAITTKVMVEEEEALNEKTLLKCGSEELNLWNQMIGLESNS